jgi:hypothetical protein
MVWNECIRFGRHIKIQISYKKLRLEVQKKTSILYNLPCLQEGCFKAVLDSNEAIDVLELRFFLLALTF